MLVKRMLSYPDIESDIRMGVPDSHWNELNNQSDFIKTAYTKIVDRFIPYDQLSYFVDVLPINDGIAQIPEGVIDFIGIYGVDATQSRRQTREGWHKEIVAHMQRATDGCVYTVMRDCDDCDVDIDCNYPVVIAARDFEEQLGIGDKRWLYRHYWGHGEKNGLCTDPYTNDFYLMQPNRSKFFERGGGDKLNSINFKIDQERNEKYEYVINEDYFECGIKQGFLLASWRGKTYDSARMLKFPYSETVLSAIVSFVHYRLYLYLFRVDPNKYGQMYTVAKQEWVEAERLAGIEMNKIGYHKMVSIINSVKSRQFGNDSFIEKTTLNYPNWVRIMDDRLKNV